MPTQTISETTQNGITILVKEISGLKQKYYALDILGKKISGCRTLRTMTSPDQSKVFGIATSLTNQLNNNVDFWQLNFKI
jgi:hypothetical protein